MLRNHEVATMLFLMGCISVLAIIAGSLLSVASAILILIVSLLIITCWLISIRTRYREIEKLSEYLRKISAGDNNLDVRDNREGELSILKNEIYKVTLRLSEQGTLLQDDKIRLTNAISDISHQLKTPITSMTVMADLLSDDDLPHEKRKEFVHNIQVQLERIEWLVTSLLKLSKIDAGTVTFKKDVVHVEELVQKALKPLLIPMDIKAQTVSITGDPEVTFKGDLNWTVEAFINILKNCVEHTGIGGAITITFAENTLFTEIEIADNGKGILKGDLPYIFKRFYKGKTGNEDSAGIGLAMAHSIITSQSGSIDVQSEVGKGTTFHIKMYKQIV